MSLMAVKIKVMPTSPEVDLEELKNKIRKRIIDSSNSNVKFEEEPIAFGLKALIISLGWPEDRELDSLEEELKKIENVNSVEVIDIRRAFG
ncbi:MAG: elongation factor 1-beta [Nanoarchaeota archaeon]|nr:elongation factor 1-beta [Nanoarchaeota archaeon]